MKLQILAILLTIASATAYIVSKSKYVGGNEIQTVFSNIEDFMEKNPGVKVIPMNVNSQYNISRSYSVGSRQTGTVHIHIALDLNQGNFLHRIFISTLGDVVVANVADKHSWPMSQNVTTTLTYPSAGGSGAFLTYILINCEQSSNVGQAYITYGGIHQHFIQIVIDTRITTYFNYAAFFYGIK
jgi:Transcription activator MBF2